MCDITTRFEELLFVKKSNISFVAPKYGVMNNC